jgi:hypothetical protein
VGRIPRTGATRVRGIDGRVPGDHAPPDACHPHHGRGQCAQAGDEIGSADVNGFTFYFADDISIALPPVRELSVEKKYATPHGIVLLRGRLDGDDGHTVHDHKLTFSGLDVERYAESLQWKAYLDMTGRRRFQYNVFIGKLSKDEREVTVSECHSFEFWPYPEMGDEVHQRVCELAEFVSKYVPELIVPDDWQATDRVDQKPEIVVRA